MTSTATRYAMLDLDGTLVDSIGAMRKWAEGLCTDYQLPSETTDWLIDRRDSYSTWQSFIGAVSEHLGQPEKMKWDTPHSPNSRSRSATSSYDPSSATHGAP